MMDNSLLNNKLLVILVLIIASPIIIMLGEAMIQNDSASNHFSFSGFDELLTSLRLGELLTISIRALVVCVLATTISFFSSYLLVFYTSNIFRLSFLILITLPFLANESVRVFSWQYVLSENGLFNKILSIALRNTITVFNGSNLINVYVVMIIACIPFGIFINTASLITIPKIYWTAASDLNVSSFNRLFSIALPLSKVALLISVLIIFFIAFSLSAEVNFLGGDSKISVRSLILSLMSASKFQAIFSLGSIITILLLITILLFSLFNNYKKIIKNEAY